MFKFLVYSFLTFSLLLPTTTLIASDYDEYTHDTYSGESDFNDSFKTEEQYQQYGDPYAQYEQAPDYLERDGASDYDDTEYGTY